VTCQHLGTASAGGGGWHGDMLHSEIFNFITLAKYVWAHKWLI